MCVAFSPRRAMWYETPHQFYEVAGFYTRGADRHATREDVERSDQPRQGPRCSGRAIGRAISKCDDATRLGQS